MMTLLHHRIGMHIHDVLVHLLLVLSEMELVVVRNVHLHLLLLHLLVMMMKLLKLMKLLHVLLVELVMLKNMHPVNVYKSICTVALATMKAHRHVTVPVEKSRHGKVGIHTCLGHTIDITRISAAPVVATTLLALDGSVNVLGTKDQPIFTSSVGHFQ